MINKATLRLFKALPIDSKKKKNPSKELLEKTIKKGFVFSPEVIANYSNYEPLIKLVKEEYGLTAEQLNNSFHKSWIKVRDASDEQLFLEQILHYITTYGFEALGIYDKGLVYIPNEKLEIPSLKEDIKLIVIEGEIIKPTSSWNSFKRKNYKRCSGSCKVCKDKCKRN